MIIDFHAHVIPKADHGCDSAETARRQLELANAAGVNTIVATPHFYPHRQTVEQFLKNRERGKELLDSVWDDGLPMVLLGAEVLVCPGMEHMEGIEQLCIEGSDRALLLELPFENLNNEIWTTVFEIWEKGFTPVLAHLNRYPPDVVKQAEQLGIQIQLNAEAFQLILHRKKWKRFAQTSNVTALGSDIHGADENSYKAFSTAVHILGQAADEIMTKTKKILTLQVEQGIGIS